MTKENYTVLGAFKTTQGASAAASRLLTLGGFTQDQVSVLMSEAARDHLLTLEQRSKAPEGAALGGVAGGVLGAIAVGLTSVASVAVPALGLLVGGPLIAALAGGGAGAAAGGLIGALVGLGLNEQQAHVYKDLLHEGGVVVAVDAASQTDAKQAMAILQESGALKLDTETGRPILA